MKRPLNTKEIIEMLAHVARDFGPEDFCARIWTCLGSEGHERIKAEFSKRCSFETYDQAADLIGENEK